MPFALRFAIAMLVLTTAAPAVEAQVTWSPPRLETATIPVTPVSEIAISGGEVFLEVTVSDEGNVESIRVLRQTPPFTENVLAAVRQWVFAAAERTEPVPADPATGAPASTMTVPVASKVFVGAIYRPPGLHARTLGTPPENVAAAGEDIAFPSRTVTPGFPPLALLGGTVVTEVRVAEGATEVTVFQSGAGFDEAAVGAASQWTFRPAVVDGRVEPTYAYLLFSFRPPRTSPESDPVSAMPTSSAGRRR